VIFHLHFHSCALGRRRIAPAGAMADNDKLKRRPNGSKPQWAFLPVDSTGFARPACRFLSAPLPPRNSRYAGQRPDEILDAIQTRAMS